MDSNGRKYLSLVHRSESSPQAQIEGVIVDQTLSRRDRAKAVSY